MVVYPYTKWMVANPNVDMAFALLVCSAEEAGRRGISRDRWVFPASAAVCDDRCWFSELGSYSESPHHRLTARAALELASVDAADIAYLDLYACFPSVVQLEADALGIDPLDREITVTGGLPFLGGPLASYMGHAIATMMDLLRHDSTELGLCVGNGGYLNKLASAVYAAKPPNRGFRVRDVSERARATPHRRRSVGAADDLAVEASTVVFDHDGPAQALVSMLAPSGERHLGSSRDTSLMHALLDDHHVGDRASVSVEGVVHLHD
jgi:acetyl-CoA C-acetyltransferase